MKHFFLLRGLIRESGHWGDFIPYLEKAFKKNKITTMDIPGTGVYYNDRSPLTIKAMVKSMRESYQKELIGKPERVLIAISLGGMIAAEWAKLFPNDFDRLIIINSSFRGFSPIYKRLKLSNIPRLIVNGFRRNINAKEATIIKTVSNRPEKYQQTLKVWVDIQHKRPVSVSNSMRQLIAAARFHASKKRPRPLVLLLSGKGDRLVSPQCTLDIEKIWQVSHWSHPDAGHALTLDEPEWVVKQMKNWFKVAKV